MQDGMQLSAENRSTMGLVRFTLGKQLDAAAMKFNSTVNEYAPVVVKLDELLGVTPSQLFGSLAVIIAIMVIRGYNMSQLANLWGAFIPMIQTSRTLEVMLHRNQARYSSISDLELTHQLQQRLTYWLVYGSFICAEAVMPFFIDGSVFFFLFKFVFLFFCFQPGYELAFTLHDRFLSRILKRAAPAMEELGHGIDQVVQEMTRDGSTAQDGVIVSSQPLPVPVNT